MPEPSFAICIPTFNRAELLRETLSHLADHQSLFDELIIGDNASPDHTREVVAELAPRFNRLTYIRHDENIGPWRNNNAVLAVTRCRYQYLLSDDDRIIPEGIEAGLKRLTDDHEAVAVYGSYRDVDLQGNLRFRASYCTVPTRLTAADYRAVLHQGLEMWNPIMRSEIYQRHVYCEPNAFPHWQMLTQLMAQGAVWLVPDDFYVHYATAQRLEKALVEAWYHEFGRTDLELALSRLQLDGGAELAAKLVQARSQDYQRIALAMASEQPDPAKMYHFMMRLRAYDKRWPELEQKWEEEQLIAMTLGLIAERLNRTARSHIVVEEGELNLGALLPRLQSALPNARIDLVGQAQLPALQDETDLAVLVEQWSAFSAAGHADAPRATRIAWYDTMSQFRLTDEAGPRALLGPDGSVHFVEFATGAG